MDVREKGWDSMDWIDLADSDQWRALVNTIINFVFQVLEWLCEWWVLKKSAVP
jgi:hypothetical protein